MQAPVPAPVQGCSRQAPASVIVTNDALQVAAMPGSGGIMDMAGDGVTPPAHLHCSCPTLAC